MIYRIAALAGKELRLTEENGQTINISLSRVERLDVEITDNVLIILHFIDEKNPKEYQAHEINAEWTDWQTRFKLRNEL